MKQNILLNRPYMTSAFAAVSLMTTGCANVASTMLPRIQNTTTVDPANCMDTKTKKFDAGWLLFFLPIQTLEHKNSTRINQECKIAMTAASVMATSPYPAHQAIAVILYEEKFNPFQKKLVEMELAKKGMDLQSFLDRAPHKVRTVQDEQGVAVYYQMKGAEFEAMHYQAFSNIPAAANNNQAQAQVPQPQ